jgi:SAM-dependent methyltransferase
MSDSIGHVSDRFLGRVADYAKARPGYPPELLGFLFEAGALFPGARVVDIGSGTGLSTELFLAGGYEVTAVEPNAEMRAAAERRFSEEPRFRSVDGRAESTGLATGGFDLAVAAQAFHWFDAAATRAELRRILVPPHRAALIWNSRRAAGSPFLERYERLLLDFGTDYEKVGHRGVGADRLRAFFGGDFATFRVENVQRLEGDGVRSRLLSSSYVPAAGSARHEAMLEELARILATTADAGGRVEMVYDCELFVGELRDLDAARSSATGSPASGAGRDR